MRDSQPNTPMAFPVPRAAWVEVDLDAIAWNTRQVKGMVGDVELLAVVKADGYGLGAVEVSPVMLSNGADRLGIVMPMEGIELRRAGIKGRIVVLGGILPEEAGLAVEHDLEPEVPSSEVAKALSEAADGAGRCVSVHLEIDTGMGRYGVRFDEAVKWITWIGTLPSLRVDGVMTHFCMSDCTDKTFSLLQLSRFLEVRRELEARGIRIPTWHMANSGGTLDLPQARLDMVRNGIMLYGYYPSGEVQRPLELRPAMSLKARIASIRTIQSGESVGYGRRFIAERPERIAVLPVGYADGYDRKLTNQGTVLIGGRRAPIVGGICMDACFVKVTDFPDAETGDTVTLMGIDGEEEISPHDIAGTIGSVSYEVISGFGMRLPRVYIRDGRPRGIKSILTGWNEERV